MQSRLRNRGRTAVDLTDGEGCRKVISAKTMFTLWLCVAYSTPES
jgi:hypothetical protein